MKVRVLLALGLMSLAHSSQASIFQYAPPALVGTRVTYTSVSETSSTSDAALYNAPTLSGNSLLFRDLSLAADSIGASPEIDFVDGQINVTLKANPGSALSVLTLSEFGDYNVSATPSNPAAINFVKVYAQAVQITVRAENGVPLDTPLVDNTSVVMSVSPSGGDYQTGVDPATGSWAGLATANLAALFGSSAITEVSISYDNQLLAESQIGGIATIAKKGFSVEPQFFALASTAPEPASGLLIGLSTLSVVGRRSRRDNAGHGHSRGR